MKRIKSPRSGTSFAGGSRPRVRVLDRAVDVLTCFTETNASLSLQAISKKTGIHKATAFRILSTLVNEKILDQPASEALYELGFFALRCADTILDSNELRRRALPIMVLLRDELNETVVLALRRGNSTMNVDKVVSHQGIIEAPTIGIDTPLHESPAGLAILTTFAEGEIDQYLKAVCPDWGSVETSAVYERIGKTKALLANPVRASAQTTIAAPISDQGRAIAALSIAIPEERADRDLVQRCLKKLLQASSRL
jgi:DNA-binding IclR family transcriptional regulator